MKSMEDDIRSLELEELQLRGKQPPAPHRLQQVREWAEERRAALERQRALLKEKQLALLKAESELRAAETVASLAEASSAPGVPSGRQSAGGTQAIASSRTSPQLGPGDRALSSARRVHDREVAGAKSRAGQLAAAAARERAALEQRRADEAARADAAGSAQDEARRRLREALQRAGQGAKGAAAAVDELEERRRESLLQLKSDLDGVRRVMAAKADINRWLAECVFV